MAKKTKDDPGGKKDKKNNPVEPPQTPVESVPAAEPKRAPKQITILDRPTTEHLAVDLSIAEINSYAHESARLHGDIAKLKQQQKDTVADFKAKIGGMETRVNDLNRKIESGTEDRQVACIWRFDYGAGTKTLFRKPANAAEAMIEIKSYGLLPEERQMTLPIKETLADKVAAAAEARAEFAGEPPQAPNTANVLPFESDEEQSHANAGESADERRIRIWCNSIDKVHRKDAFGIAEEGEAVAGLLTLPYRRMSEGDKEIVRQHYRAYSDQKADTNKKDPIPF